MVVPESAPVGIEIALVTDDVRSGCSRALKAGAAAVSELEKPREQTGFLRAR